MSRWKVKYSPSDRITREITWLTDNQLGHIVRIIGKMERVFFFVRSKICKDDNIYVKGRCIHGLFFANDLRTLRNHKVKNVPIKKDDVKTDFQSKWHKKGVRFENVKIYLFERTQGFDVIPSSGGIALGMHMKHFDINEVALCSKVTDDGITKLQNDKLSAKGLVKQVCTASTRRKQRYCNAFDKNSAVTKRRRSVERGDEILSKTKATTNVDRRESRIPERTSTSMPEIMLGQVDNVKEKNEEENICITNKYFRPLNRRIRLLKLRRAGFKKFVDDESICDDIRKSRKHCGCSCGILPCSPKNCECSRNGIECLVDRPSFPCTCATTSCNNPFGRREFDEVFVHAHFRSILMRAQIVQD
ncbi:unnamed protein product [Cercopithifilaria johnstoni]|uniref:Cysteine/serine-rich nuclear protein N-terminal domain-containing protein n=1 Tax=Cercopithifilaria johnstoni TaxID=2874296 RepID=A0A8J2LVW3_9BILA|nr:unnamed protein product [Cercopithifilaria johnstoni]